MKSEDQFFAPNYRYHTNSFFTFYSFDHSGPMELSFGALTKTQTREPSKLFRTFHFVSLSEHHGVPIFQMHRFNPILKTAVNETVTLFYECFYAKLYINNN